MSVDVRDTAAADRERIAAANHQVNAHREQAAKAFNAREIRATTSRHPGQRALNLVTVVGALGAHQQAEDRKLPKHLQRRICSARELREAAAQAAEGSAMPGTLAAIKIDEAEKAGQFEQAKSYRAWVKRMARSIEEEAAEAERHERLDAMRFEQSKHSQERRLSQADAKRARRKARRRPQ